jgi:hypothetical protein
MKGRSVEKVVLTLYNAYSYTGMAVNDGDQTQQAQGFRGSPGWSGGSPGAVRGGPGWSGMVRGQSGGSPGWSSSSGSGRFSGSKRHGQLLGIRIHSADP